MNVRQIITDYLTANGYDGLTGDECGCLLGGLAPCCDDSCGDCLDCEPGYKTTPVEDTDYYDDWIVVTEKPK